MTTVLDLIVSRVYTELASRKGYTWEAASARYRDNQTGRFVAEKTIREGVEKYNENFVRPNVKNITQNFLDDKTKIDAWQRSIAKEIKDAYIVNVQIGRGGKNATTYSDYGRMGGRLQFEYRKLNDFAEAIKRGELSDEQILYRAQMYADGVRTAYYDGLTAAHAVAGFAESRRVLTPAEHCEDCVTYAGMGWRPIGVLPSPGTMSRCLHNCKCLMEYRGSEEIGQ